MKTKSKCIGCQSIKLVNALSLCKRCNREAHKYISAAEMERIKQEREMMLAAAKSAKKIKKEEAPKEGEGEEGAPEEGAEEDEEEDEGEDKGRGKGRGKGARDESVEPKKK